MQKILNTIGGRAVLDAAVIGAFLGVVWFAGVWAVSA